MYDRSATGGCDAKKIKIKICLCDHVKNRKLPSHSLFLTHQGTVTNSRPAPVRRIALRHTFLSSPSRRPTPSDSAARIHMCSSEKKLLYMSPSSGMLIPDLILEAPHIGSSRSGSFISDLRSLQFPPHGAPIVLYTTSRKNTHVILIVLVPKTRSRPQSHALTSTVCPSN
jgi:hypothetical protein